MSAAAPRGPSSHPYPSDGPAGYHDLPPPSSGERAYAHIEDLKRLAGNNNPNASIRHLLDLADTGLKQAVNLNQNFRRPDLAFVEYLRAFDIVANVIPHHHDWASFSIDQPERAQQWRVLRHRISGLADQFDAIKSIIINNNRRCGTVPKEQQHQHNGTGHVQRESGTGPQANGGPRMRPTPSPKPEKLHGRALSNASTNGTRSEADRLNERFASLRMSGMGQPRPDSRSSDRSSMNGSPKQNPSANDYTSRDSFDTLGRANGRPQGPRGMPNGGPPPPLDIPMNLPQEPAATYSPARNMQTKGNVTAPRHSARSLASSSARRTPSSSYAPNGPGASGDYFPTANASTKPPGPPRRSVSTNTESSMIPNKLYDYFRLYNVLLIDFRPRADFDKGHIWHRNLICVEPMSVRQGMSAEELAESLVVCPDVEQELFANRDTFDLVVCYDEDTQHPYPYHSSRRGEGLRCLHEALTDFNQEKPLQRPPILLKGGIDAWADMTGRHALATTDTRREMERARQQSSASGIRRRPLATAAANGKGQLRVPKRRLRNIEQLDEEEEQSWRERARAESVVLPQAPTLDGIGLTEEPEDEGDLTTQDAIEAFNARFPDAGSLDRHAFASQLPSRQPPEPPAKPPQYPPAPPASVYPDQPAPPTRPAPAAARMSYTGVSDRQPSGSTPSSRRTDMAPYIPPKFLPANMRLPMTGLFNFSQTCYLNACLQALSATTPLSSFFMDDNYRSQLQRANWMGSQGAIFTELYANLIRSLWKRDVAYVRPTTFRNFLRRTAPDYDNDEQHDAMSIFGHIFDTLHEDLNAGWSRTPIRELTLQEEAVRARLPTPLVSRIEWGRSSHRARSYLHDLFAGQEASRTECLVCGTARIKFDKFTSLAIEIPSDSRTWERPGAMPSLHDCLRSYCRTERLSVKEKNGWMCPECKVERDATKQFTLTRLPSRLVVSLKRFDNRALGQTRKKTTPVDFPLKSLDLKPYTLHGPAGAALNAMPDNDDSDAHEPPDPAITPPFVYDAYAVISHLGDTLQSGHYITAARDAARDNQAGVHTRGGREAEDLGSWLRYDDRKVTRFGPADMGSGEWRDWRAGAYIMFYARVGA
ncbi:hypothetical protein B0A50_05027 [Salinomyces thailandicus]|uniref:USP domain-containing protein n=1 Tax=Salinomyces thailandicus TaxID=706561 RepID=A0A4U0U039_9PEZI|nr:hypothetical protein B0A50_05027 [Salinomyces thailandica]